MFPKLFWVLFSLASTLMNGVVSLNDAREVTGTEPHSNCYAVAVRNELMKAIKIIQDHTPTGLPHDSVKFRQDSHVPKKFQEDEDYGTDVLPGGLEIPSIVPQIFKIVGSALSLNSSAVTESSFGVISPGLSHRLTSVLGALASGILGPGIIPTTTPLPRPPSRRRRRTTTTSSTVAPDGVTMGKNETNGNNTVTVEGLMKNTSNSTNATSTEEAASSTEEALFKESSLGELPVYAAAYAPNYLAPTTTYPLYANKFLHAIYSAPTTTTTTPPTTTDPNSFAVELPFDYQDRLITTPKMSLFFNMNHGNSSGLPEYEYEYDNEDAKEERNTGSDNKDESRYRHGHPALESAVTTQSSIPLQKVVVNRIIWTKEKDGDIYKGSGVSIITPLNS